MRASKKKSKNKGKSSKSWEQALEELRAAKDRDGLLEKLLVAASCTLDAVQVFAVLPDQLQGFMALDQDKVEREAVRQRLLPVSESSLAVTAAQTGILNLGPVPESEPALQLLPPGTSADHGLLFLPVALKQRTVFLLMGAPKDKIKPELRAQMDQLSQEAAVSLAEIILQARGKRPSAEMILQARAKRPSTEIKPAASAPAPQKKTPPRRPIAPILVQGPTTERAKEPAAPAAGAPEPAAGAGNARQESPPPQQAPLTTSPLRKRKPTEPQIAAIDKHLMEDLDWDLDPELLDKK